MSDKCPFRAICEIPAGEGRVTTYGAAGRLCGYEQAGTVENCKRARRFELERRNDKND